MLKKNIFFLFLFLISKLWSSQDMGSSINNQIGKITVKKSTDITKKKYPPLNQIYKLIGIYEQDENPILKNQSKIVETTILDKATIIVQPLIEPWHSFMLIIKHQNKKFYIFQNNKITIRSNNEPFLPPDHILIAQNKNSDEMISVLRVTIGYVMTLRDRIEFITQPCLNNDQEEPSFGHSSTIIPQEYACYLTGIRIVEDNKPSDGSSSSSKDSHSNNQNIPNIPIGSTSNPPKIENNGYNSFTRSYQIAGFFGEDETDKKRMSEKKDSLLGRFSNQSPHIVEIFEPIYTKISPVIQNTSNSQEGLLLKIKTHSAMYYLFTPDKLDDLQNILRKKNINVLAYLIDTEEKVHILHIKIKDITLSKKIHSIEKNIPQQDNDTIDTSDNTYIKNTFNSILRYIFFAGIGFGSLALLVNLIKKIL